MVGVIRISKSGILSGLNNVSVYAMHNEEFSSSFGFTQEEVKLLLEGYKFDSDGIDEATKLYSGYCSHELKGISNPWSIMRLCNERKFERYWVETGMASCEMELTLFTRM